MIAINDKCELQSTIVSTTANSFDISITEIMVDGKSEKFTVPKVITVLLADYDGTVLTDSEKALFKTLVTKYASTLTCPDDVATANSAKAKLI